MSFAAPAANVFHALDVLLHLTTQGAFDDVVRVDLTCERGYFLVIQVFGALLGINLATDDDLLRIKAVVWPMPNTYCSE